MCKPKVNIGQLVRVRLQVRHKKTNPIYSEPHRVDSFVALFTVMLENGKKWHCSKIRSCDSPDDDDVIGI